MIVYDMIRVVAPGHYTSYPLGRYPVDCYSDESAAVLRADMANMHAPPCVRYEVVARDEMDPARAEDDQKLQAAWREQ